MADSRFATMSLDEAQKTLADVRQKSVAIYDGHKLDNGETDYAKFTADEVDDLKKWAGDAAELSTRIETLESLVDGEKRLDELNTFLSRKGAAPVIPTRIDDATTVEYKDAGYVFANSEIVKAYLETGQRDIEFDVKMAQFSPRLAPVMRDGLKMPSGPWGRKDTLGTDSGAAGVDTQYAPEVLRMQALSTNILGQTPNIADLCIQVGTSQNAISYMAQTTRTNAAAETAEAGTAPESAYEWTVVNDPIRKITHTLPITDELLSDAPWLRALVNSEMDLGVREREDLQLLNGAGTGVTIEGFNNRTGVQNVNFSLAGDITAQVYGEKILRAITLGAQQHRRASGVVVSALTWEFLRLAKDGQLNYLFAGMQDDQIQRIWGAPVAVNENQDDYDTATNVGATVGPFATDAFVVRRDNVSLSISDSHGTTFAEDTLTIKAKERVGLAVLRPAAFVTLTTVA